MTPPIPSDSAKSAKDLVDSLLSKIPDLPAKYRPLAYGLVIFLILIMGMTYLLVNSGALSQGWLVLVVIALLLTLIVIALILRPTNSKKPTLPQEITIRGYVVDGDGNRVSGAKVWIANDEDRAVITDSYGEYRLLANPELSRWEITVANGELVKPYNVEPTDLKDGLVPPIKLVPDAKSENKIILEALQETQDTLKKHFQCIRAIVKPVEDNPFDLLQTIRKFTEMVEQETEKGEGSFSKEYSTLVYGTLHSYKTNLKPGELKDLLNSAIDEVIHFQTVAYTYDSLHRYRELQKLGDCWKTWNTDGNNDFTAIDEAHQALADSIESFVKENSSKKDDDKSRDRKERWEQDLRKFREMPIESKADIAALVQEWARQWIDHVGRTRRGCIDKTIERFSQAVDQERLEPAK